MQHFLPVIQNLMCKEFSPALRNPFNVVSIVQWLTHLQLYTQTCTSIWGTKKSLSANYRKLPRRWQGKSRQVYRDHMLWYWYQQNRDTTICVRLPQHHQKAHGFPHYRGAWGLSQINPISTQHRCSCESTHGRSNRVWPQIREPAAYCQTNTNTNSRNNNNNNNSNTRYWLHSHSLARP